LKNCALQPPQIAIHAQEKKVGDFAIWTSEIAVEHIQCIPGKLQLRMFVNKAQKYFALAFEVSTQQKMDLCLNLDFSVICSTCLFVYRHQFWGGLQLMMFSTGQKFA
jgi:hypothetical protein